MFKVQLLSTQGIDFINDHMETAAAGEGNVTYVSCNEGFIMNGHIDGALMPDALHPNAAGELQSFNIGCSAPSRSQSCHDVGMHFHLEHCGTAERFPGTHSSCLLPQQCSDKCLVTTAQR